MEQLQTSIIDEMEQYKPIPYATSWQRFANYLIDLVVVYLLFFVAVFLVAALSPSLGEEMGYFFESQELGDKLLGQLIGIVYWIVFYTAFEWLTKGRTIGKFITGTKAVMENGDPINLRQAFLRSLTRAIPFEPFSAFSGSGMWHDRIPKTMVIKTR